jgi:predicted negative regulator of RcsB-dependent stress response
MKRGNRAGAWGLYEWVMTGLLTVCATLLGISAVLMWTYFPVMASGSNSSSVTKYESRIEAALSALQQQQAFSNSALDAIRSELRALNDKAGKAAEVTPPE